MQFGQPLMGSGTVVSVRRTSLSYGDQADPFLMCVLTVEVATDGGPAYTATCRQAVRASLLAQLLLGGGSVGVLIDPDDRGHVELLLDGKTDLRTIVAGRSGPSGGAISP